MKPLRKILLAGALALLPISLHAAAITAAGTMTDLTPAGFAVGTDVADLDAAGAGADGFVVFNSLPEGSNVGGAPWNANIVDNSPAYVTALNGLSSGSSGGWANYDDVTVGGTNYNTGGITNSPGNGVEAAMFSFDTTGTVPAVITLGLLVDNSDSPNWDVLDVRIEGPGAVTANQAVVPNGGSDLVQFDISGAVAGETYTVYATSPPSGALIGAATFDSIPEPSGALLLGTGLLMAVARRRRVRA